MVDVLSAEELASYLERPVTPGMELIVGKVNQLITESWDDAATASEPYPVRVWGLAVSIATRALSPASRGLTSITESWDDVQTTERYGEAGGGHTRTGVYITDEEIAALNGVLDEVPASIGTISTPTRWQVPSTRSVDSEW